VLCRLRDSAKSSWPIDRNLQLVGPQHDGQSSLFTVQQLVFKVRGCVCANGLILETAHSLCTDQLHFASAHIFAPECSLYFGTSRCCVVDVSAVPVIVEIELTPSCTIWFPLHSQQAKNIEVPESAFRDGSETGATRSCCAEAKRVRDPLNMLCYEYDFKGSKMTTRQSKVQLWDYD
jgi:hypothetical protein